MMDATEVDGTNRLRQLVDELTHRVDVAREQDAVALIARESGEVLCGRGDAFEEHIHGGRHAHAIELLLPVTRRDLIIDEHDEPQVERLAPPHDDLAVDAAIIDAKQINGHQATPRWREPRALSRPHAAPPRRRRDRPGTRSRAAPEGGSP